jgi:hypothetical protein
VVVRLIEPVEISSVAGPLSNGPEGYFAKAADLVKAARDLLGRARKDVEMATATQQAVGSKAFKFCFERRRMTK